MKSNSEGFFGDRPVSVQWHEDGHGIQPGGAAAKRIVFLDDEDTATNTSTSSPLGRGRPVSAQINPARFARWLSLCEEFHPHTCSPEPCVTVASGNPSGLRVLRVIDVLDKCVVELPPGDGYVALSYLWGKAPMLRLLKSNKKRLMTKGGLTDPSLDPPLPKTIADSIEVVDLMGQRYIWADCLCLIQDDGDDMADGISKMDLVYRGARVTIIAATGSDANAGLPGLRPGSRPGMQYVEEVKPGVKMALVDGLFDLFKYFQGSYQTRGWT
jgi:hypothetical protein